MDLDSPSPRVFTALLSGNVKQLAECSEHDLRPFLPSLARMILSPSLVSMATQWEGKRKIVRMLISGMAEVNAIQEYLALNYKELKQDARREQQLLKKLGPLEGRPPTQSVLASSLQFGLAIEFERSDYLRRFRLFLSEILRIIAQLDVSGPFKVVQSDLFECEVHLEEVGDILCLAAVEMPDLFSVVQLSEALLCLERGPQLLAKMVANMPDTFHQVVTHLVLNGETLDEVSLAGRCRASAIKTLCIMHPTQAAYVQGLAIDNCKHPTLALWLALQAEKNKEVTSSGSGVIILLYNIIIVGDDEKRAWFSQYLKCMQQKYRKHRLSAVTQLRSFLMKKLCSFLKKPSSPRDSTPPPPELQSQQSSDDESMDDDEQEDQTTPPGEQKEPVVLDTLEDLVDQMEIEISDHEDEQSEQKPDMVSTKDDESAEVKGHHRKDKGQGKKRLRRMSTLEGAEFRPISLDYQLCDDDIIDLMQVLQVCCGLKTQTMMYLKEEEAGAILSLIVSTCPPFSPAGVTFIKTTLCVLLACPFLISVDDCETAVVSWFKWLLEKLPEFDRACGGWCSYGELLLLMAIHLREGQLDQIRELVTDTLQMTISGSLKSGHFIILRKLFLSVFTEDVVCAHAVSVPPTPGLSGHMTGYLPIHCVHQLVKTRTFRKHGIPVKDWIYRQLSTLAEPVHPVLGPLLQEFVHSILLSPLLPRVTTAPTYGNKSADMSHQPLTAEEVLSVFGEDPAGVGGCHGAIASQVVMFYYLVLYQDCYHSNMTALLVHSRTYSTTPGAYSSSIAAQIPLKYLLTHVQTHQSLYTSIYPSLLKITAIHFPQLCLVCEILQERKEESAMSCFKPIVSISKEKVNPISAREILGQLPDHPSQALLLLSHLDTLPPSQLPPYTPVLLSTLTRLLTPTLPRRIQDLYVNLWIKLNALAPRGILIQTVNALRPLEMAHLRPYTHHSIAEDPLILLRCDKKVFRCPPLFDVLLRMVAMATSYSSFWLRDHAHTQHCVATAEGKLPPAEMSSLKAQREEQCSALIAAQDSAIVQLLLEICLPTDEDKEEEGSFGSQLGVLQEIHCLLCSYLHHTFIEQPNLVKLVHFQGYPTQLLPMIVSGVPSIHICMDFIPELLAQPQIDKQQFGIQLAAHVIHQYPLPEVLPIAEDIFKRLFILTNEIPDHLRENFFKPLLPSVLLLSRTFPPLCSEATKLLVGLCRTCPPSVNDVWAGNSPKGGVSGSLAITAQRTFNELVNCTVVKV